VGATVPAGLGLVALRDEFQHENHPALSGVRKCKSRRKSVHAPFISYGIGGITNHENVATLVLWGQILRVQFLLLTKLFAAKNGVGGI